MRKHFGIVLTAVAALAMVSSLTAGVAYAGVAASKAFVDPTGLWDYAYTGDADTFTGTSAAGNLDGTFTGSANRWDGSAPGTFSNPGTNPGGDSPGGVVAVTGSGADAGVNYLRIQDTGEPSSYATGGASNWSTPDNGKIFLGHLTEQDNPGSGPLPIITNGMTVTFRTRIATTGTLDDVYTELGGGTSAWPTGGKGFRVGGSGRAMFTVGQGNVNQVGFSLLTTADIQASSGDTGLTGGLYMNNQIGAVDKGTANSTAATANFVPISDSSLTDWHEFWIKLEGTAGSFVKFTATVYMDGNTTPVGTFTDVTAASDIGTFVGSVIAMGGGSGSGFGAWDTDFYAYTLTALDPVGIPEPATMSLMVLGALAIVGLRRRQA